MLSVLFILVQNGIHFHVLITKHVMYLYKIICFVLFLNFPATIISSFLKFQILTFQICGKIWYVVGYRFWSPLFQYCQKIRAKQSQLETWQWLGLAKTICTLLVLPFLYSWLLYLMYICNLYFTLYISKWLRKKIQKTSAITPTYFKTCSSWLFKTIGQMFSVH